MTIRDFLDRLENVRQSGSNWVARCPAHDDKHNSLSISEGGDGRVLIKCHAGCEAKDIVEAVGLTLKDLFEKSSTRTHKKSREKDKASPKSDATTQPGCTVEEYAKDKQLEAHLLNMIGVRDYSNRGATVVRIPYYGPDKTEVAVRYRTALKKSAQEDNRFRWKSGSKPTLYGLWRIGNAEQDGFVLLVEGESDTHTGWQYGLPVLGLPGAALWREEWAQYFSNIPVIYVFLEPDKGGEAVIKWLSKSELRHKARLVRLKDSKDINELHCADPQSFKQKLKEAMDAAITWKDFDRTDQKKKRQEAWTKCQQLAQEQDILTHFSDSLSRSGVVGEERAAKLIYLCLTSRVLPKPVSVVVKAVSSAGKSFLSESTLKYFPDTAYYALTAMSERALAYSEEPLKHRFMVFYEAAGIKGDFVSYIIRSLLSEGRLRYETVEKTQGGLKPKMIEREGPTGLLVTTTDLRLHAENETRLFSVSITDTPEQTRSIMQSLAQERRIKTDFQPWHALQDWVGYGECDVTIPYASALADMVPPVAVRLRRDFGAVLNLIRAHAILHQVNRERDKQGYIIATFSDYAAVRDLVADIVSEGIEMTVSDALRDTVRAVENLKSRNSQEPVTFAAIARELSIDKSTAKRRADAAVEAGYLKNQALKGRPADLVVGEALPEDQHILPLEAELRQRCMVAEKPEEIITPPQAPAAVPITQTQTYSNFPLYGKPHDHIYVLVNDRKGAYRRCKGCGEFEPKNKTNGGNMT